MTDTSKEACKHQMRTYKSVVIGDYRKRYRRCNCTGCDYHDTLLVPMVFSYLKSDRNTNVGIESVEQTTESPTLE